MEAQTNHFLSFVNSSSKQIGASFRPQRSGPELNLIEDFLRVAQFRVPSGFRVTIFREPKLESGFPDLVIVLWREEITRSWLINRLYLEQYDLRLMHFIHYKKRVYENEINKFFGRRAIKSLKRLADVSMIHSTRRSWIPSPLHSIFATSKIVSIEAKIGNWKKVLNQASLNTWFASKSYVLVSKSPSPDYYYEAKKRGLGVCYPENPEIRELFCSSNSHPKSYVSWLLNDWSWRHYQDFSCLAV